MKEQVQLNTIKISSYKVYQPNSHKLIIEKSWKESLFPLLLISAFFILWYYGLLSATGHDEPNIIARAINIIKDEPPLVIFFLVPLFIIFPILFKLIKKVVNRDSFLIDGKRGTIMKNNRLITSFSDISKLIIQKHSTELNLLLDDDNNINLVKSRNTASVKKIAEILSGFTKLSITY